MTASFVGPCFLWYADPRVRFVAAAMALVGAGAGYLFARYVKLPHPLATSLMAVAAAALGWIIVLGAAFLHDENWTA